jgi:uncharacterized membrane-anchored protein
MHSQVMHRASGGWWAPLALKVPEVTVWFWVIKLLSTAMGESTSDFLVFHINPYVAVVLGSLGLLLSVAIQLATPRYRAPIYWFAVVMIAVFGTMVADVLHVVIGVPYVVSTAALAAAIVVIFITWQRVEGTLSIHSIVTTRRELFYWATVIATFALGTAAGDLVASTFGLGYGPAAAAFGVAFVVPALGYRWFGWNAVAAFWTAYVITRPLGASVADWLGKSTLGGLGLGDEKVAIVLAACIVLAVAYVSVTRVDVAPERVTTAPDPGRRAG